MPETDLRNWLHTQLFERVPANIAIIDRDYRIVEANQNFADAFGEWKGRRCYEVYKGRKEHCESCPADQSFNDGKPRINDERGVDRYGKESYYVVHVEPIVRDNGEVPFVIEMSHDVTETHRLQREYGFFFDRVPCLVSVIDRDFRIVRNNELFQRTFGDSIGEKCHEVYAHSSTPCPDCPARETFSDGEIHTAPLAGTHQEGKVLHYIVTSAPISRGEKRPSHIIEMALDVSHAHALEDQLKQALAFQEKMIEYAIDGIIAADAEGRIIIFNPFAEQLFKRSAEEVTGGPIADFFPPEFAEELSRGGTSIVLMETDVRDREGTLVPVRFYGVALMSDGKRLGTACFFRDLRDRKRLERERLDAEHLAAVVQTVAGMAHGVKNVLMGLEGGMYVVSSGLKKDDKVLVEKGWEMLEKNIKRISGFVRDFLNFTKVRQLAAKMVDPNQVARDVAELYQDAAHNAGIELRASLTEGIGEASLDPEGLHACLSNLVSNAIDACAAADKKEGLVEVRTREHGSVLVYEVADNGCGLDDEARQKIFTTVFSTKGSQKGTGLGLMVTRKIVLEHGGAVTFESVLGEGSLFRMEFPRERLPAPSASDAR